MSVERDNVMKKLEQAGSILCSWYEQEKASLPWRADKDPYHVWISEIMLQQTRIEAVKPYYLRFLQAFPDIRSLAEAKEERLMKLWEGLGYYSRARNLQAAARQCCEKYGARLPGTYRELVGLPGIGSYTGGAIASICYGEKQPAVDGNVIRVLLRLMALAEDPSDPAVKKALQEGILLWMNGSGLPAGTINQSLMELGERICIPRGQPLCDGCPVCGVCEAFRRGLETSIPLKKAAKVRRIEEKTVFLITDGTHLLLKKRANKGLLAGLYEFPAAQGFLSAPDALEFARELTGLPCVADPLPPARHIFSHIEWHMRAWLVHIPENTRPQCLSDSSCAWPCLSDIEASYAVPSAFDAWRRIWTIPEKTD